MTKNQNSERIANTFSEETRLLSKTFTEIDHFFFFG